MQKEQWPKWVATEIEKKSYNKLGYASCICQTVILAIISMCCVLTDKNLTNFHCVHLLRRWKCVFLVALSCHHHYHHKRAWRKLFQEHNKYVQYKHEPVVCWLCYFVIFDETMKHSCCFKRSIEQQQQKWKPNASKKKSSTMDSNRQEKKKREKKLL